MENCNTIISPFLVLLSISKCLDKSTFDLNFGIIFPFSTAENAAIA